MHRADRFGILQLVDDPDNPALEIDSVHVASLKHGVRLHRGMDRHLVAVPIDQIHSPALYVGIVGHGGII